MFRRSKIMIPIKLRLKQYHRKDNRFSVGRIDFCSSICISWHKASILHSIFICFLSWLCCSRRRFELKAPTAISTMVILTMWWIHPLSVTALGVPFCVEGTASIEVKFPQLYLMVLQQRYHNDDSPVHEGVCSC
jgi:hypothetical protein